MGNLTIEEEKTIISNFKSELIAAGKYDEKEYPDTTLIRYLKARKYDVPNALKMIKESIQWRSDMKVDELVQSFTFPENKELRKMYPRFYHKTDLKGRPVYFEQLGLMNTKKMFEITTNERLIKVFIRDTEKIHKYRFPACSAKAGKFIDQGVSILDLKGVALTQFNQVRKMVQLVAEIAQNHYPESLGKMFIINAPMLFKGVWLLVRPLLNDDTAAKISVLGSNYEKELVEVIGQDNLPKDFGGSCQCPGGCENSDIGPWNDGTAPGFPISFWEEEWSKRDV